MTRCSSENLLFNSKMAAVQASYKYTYKILSRLYESYGNDVHTSVYDKRDDIGFPIVNFPGRVVMFLASHRTVFTFLSW